jgi:hypothetical protein
MMFVGDWIVAVCGGKRRAVAYPRRLLPRGGIKRGIKRVASGEQCGTDGYSPVPSGARKDPRAQQGAGVANNPGPSLEGTTLPND